MPIIDENSGLQAKTASGIFWTFLEQLGRRGINILVTILLARFLTPDDYGLIAMVSVFFAFANALMDVGFRQALIRKKEATQADYSTLFYTNLALGSLAYLILFVFAHAIATFYSEPRLILLIRIVGTVVIINALQFVQIVDLSRNLDFKTQFKVTIPSGIISGAVAIVMAITGAGVWSLITQMVLAPFIITASLWHLNRWRPTWEFSTESFKDLFSFGSKLFLSGILDLLFRNIYVIIIAKLFSTTLTGYYFFATKVRDIILEQFCSSIQRATFPALASLQDDSKQLKNGYRKVMQATTYLIFPAMIFLGVMACPIFNFLLHPKWLPAVPYLQLLCVAGLFYPLHVVNLNILQVKGRSDLFLCLEIIKKILITIVLLISTRHGIISILIGQIFTSILAYLPNSYFSTKLINYTAKEQLKDIFPSLFAACLSGTASVVIKNLSITTGNTFIVFILQLLIFCLIYFLASKVFRVKIQKTILDLLFKKLK